MTTHAPHITTLEFPHSDEVQPVEWIELIDSANMKHHIPLPQPVFTVPGDSLFARIEGQMVSVYMITRNGDYISIM